MKGDRRIGEKVSERGGIEREKKWTKNRTLWNTGSKRQGFRRLVLDRNRLRAVG